MNTTTTLTIDHHRVEFVQSGSAWSASCMIAYIKYTVDKIDFSPLPRPMNLQRLESLLRYPSSATIKAGLFVLEFTVDVLPKPLVITLIRDPSSVSKETCLDQQRHIILLEKALYDKSFYTATVRVNGDRIEFTADRKEDESYMAAFMNTWKEVLYKSTLTEKRDEDGVIDIVWTFRQNRYMSSGQQQVCYDKYATNQALAFGSHVHLSYYNISNVLTLDRTTRLGGWQGWMEESLEEKAKPMYLEGILFPADDGTCTIFRDDHNGHLPNGHVIARLVLRKKPVL